MTAASLHPAGIDIRVDDARWTSALPDIERLASAAVAAAMDAVGGSGGVDILFTGDAALQELNRKWRGIDKPTDVLSFPCADPPGPEGAAHLGDIALAVESSLQDAENMGRPPEAHVSHLVIHGFLHLVGYDHVDPKDAAVMEPLEARILASLGWPDPYLIDAAAGGAEGG